MLIPLLLAPIYTSALIFGPAFLIILTVCLALLIRFPSLKSWIGVVMVILGLIEVSLVPMWVLWVFIIGFSTSIIGIALLGSVLFSHRGSIVAGIVFMALGVLGILASMTVGSFWVFAFWMVVLVFGIAGLAPLLPEQRRAKIGFVATTVGFIVILIAMFTNFVALAFFVGIVVVFTGISISVSGLPYWVRSHSGGNVLRYLKKGLYVVLAVVIFSSAFVFSLRTTNALREEYYDDWSYATTADTTVRGVVTGVYLNYEVDCYGYSYHIFPALIIVNVTEVVKVGESWDNLTERSEHWVNENMTVAYDKPDVPSLIVGQRVEASGYYDVPVEDPWAYSLKLVVAPEIDGSYVTSQR